MTLHACFFSALLSSERERRMSRYMRNYISGNLTVDPHTSIQTIWYRDAENILESIVFDENFLLEVNVSVGSAHSDLPLHIFGFASIVANSQLN